MRNRLKRKIGMYIESYEPCKNRTEYLGGSLLTQEVISFYFYIVRPTDTLDSRQ